MSFNSEPSNNIGRNFPTELSSATHANKNQEEFTSLPTISDILNKYINKNLEPDFNAAALKQGTLSSDPSPLNKAANWNGLISGALGESNKKSVTDIPTLSLGGDFISGLKEQRTSELANYAGRPNQTPVAANSVDNSSEKGSQRDMMERQGYIDPDSILRDPARGIMGANPHKSSHQEQAASAQASNRGSGVTGAAEPSGEKLFRDFVARQSEYFEYTNFKDFVNEMCRPIKTQDVRTKVSELKNLVNSIKDIQNEGSEEKFESILREHLFNSKSEKAQPLYKLSSQFAPEYMKRFISAGAKSESQIVDGLEMYRKEKNPKFQYHSLINNPNIVAAQRKDQHMQEANVDEFEKYLNENKPARNSNPNSTARSHDQEHKDKQALLLNKGLESAVNDIVKNVQSGDPHVRNSLTNLQFFLSQNLKETIELKEFLKQGGSTGGGVARFGTGNGSNLSDMLISVRNSQQPHDISPGLQHSESPILPRSNYTSLQSPSLQPGNQIKTELGSTERRIREGQADRLIGKINALKKQVDELKKNSTKSQGTSSSPEQGLKVGPVKASRVVTEDFDLDSFRYQGFEDKYQMSRRYLVVKQSRLILYESEDNIENPTEIQLSDLEEILHVEASHPYAFIFKLSDSALQEDTRNHPKPDTTRQRGKHKRDKKHPYRGVVSYFIVCIEDSSEYTAWDNVFFLINVQLAFRGGLSSLNETEALHAFQSFATRYLTDSQAFELNISDKSIRQDSTGNTPKNHTAPDAERQGHTMTTLPEKIKPHYSTDEGQEIKEQSQNINYAPQMQASQQIQFAPKIGGTDLHLLSGLSESVFPFNKATPQEKSETPNSGNMRISFEQLKAEVQKQSNNQSYVSTARRKQETEENTLKRAIQYLQDGEVFNKYGVWGKPQEKRVRLTPDGMCIEWINMASNKRSKEFIEVLHIIRIEEGDMSSCFKNMRKKDLFLKDPGRVNNLFSIVAEKRTLDLEAGDPQRKTAFIEALLTIRNKKKESVDLQMITNFNRPKQQA